jgi:protein-S-isoprenylcysteine O-methyltransferase Ste14
MTEIETFSKIVLIAVFCIFSIIRIEYYRRARKAGFKTVIEEKKKYSVWLSIFICYEVATFFIFIFVPERLAWGNLPLPVWTRYFGAGMGIIALLWFVWVHRSLGANFSMNLKIKDQHLLVTEGPYRWIRHPMYTAFYILHIAVFFLTANWFIGISWIAGLSVITALRIRREETLLLSTFGEAYKDYMKNTGRFIPRLSLNGIRAKAHFTD